MNKKKKVFSGCATAIITPFKGDKVDFESFSRLIDFQIDKGVSALVVLGTTGESANVSEKERIEIIKHARKRTEGKIPLIVGAGSNSTAVAIKKTHIATEYGADAILSVTPYYNKATNEGVYRHYSEIARATSLPIILYNVPSRTGMKLSEGALDMLKDIENIVGVKEASGDISEVEQKIAKFSDFYHFYSGCDELILPIYALGGEGVISACSNVIPHEIATLCRLFEQNDIKSAREIARKISPLIKELFAEVNPIPVKCALNLMGMCENTLRLPLTPSTRQNEIKNELEKLKKNKSPI